MLAGPQWNTLDGALGGSTSWLGTMYLAALAAAEKMAHLENDPQAARRYAAIRASGARLQDQTLFNGEYYIQIPDAEPREDYGNGCAIDQLLGQWWAHQLDLGWLYPPDHARTALESLFRYNFRGNMHGLAQRPRKFVADDDPAMQMITWPKGPRPTKHILYADEAMTGFEYAAAAAMVQAGLVREGFTVARAVWTRYDGRLRRGVAVGGFNGNPFGDDECGKYYARAMSVWSMLLACQGFVHNGPAGVLGFRPIWKPEDHASFFTAAEGWGVFTQRRTADVQIARIDVRHGSVNLDTLVLQLPEGATPGRVALEGPGQAVPVQVAFERGDLRIKLARPTRLAR
ncbi:MAG: glycoside hydrolase family 116 protein, partial [Anaerolineae bacterium]|nr:glycoside hydrolase family 116 protein [Anaerolineae bacterium]